MEALLIVLQMAIFVLGAFQAWEQGADFQMVTRGWATMGISAVCMFLVWAA